MTIATISQVFTDADGAIQIVYAGEEIDPTYTPWVQPVIPAAQLLAEAQAGQIVAIEAAYQAAIQQPLAYMGTSFQADKASQDLMAQTIIGLQAVVAVGGTVPADFGWWDANNVKVLMTLLQLQGLYATGVAAVNTAFANKQAKKSSVRSASTVAAVTAIQF